MKFREEDVLNDPKQLLLKQEQNKSNKFENQLLLCQETIEKIKEMNN